MNTTWILIANSAHARVLKEDTAGRLRLVHSIEHLASRASSSDLGDDKAGRELSSSHFGGAAMVPRSDGHRKERTRFAHELAQLLEEAAREKRYGALQVFASSPFLGEVKHALGPDASRALAGTHDVDLTSVGIAELPRRIHH